MANGTIPEIPATLFVAPNFSDHTPLTTLFSPDYTYSYSKYSCIRGFYFAHVTFCYLTFLSGLVCLVTRALPPTYKKFHAWSGRLYILCMLWATATSLLIHNTGLGLSTLISFAAVLICLSVGWFAILFYRIGLQNEAFSQIKPESIEEHGGLQAAVSSKITEILEKKTAFQRLVSLKSMHGVLFFVSWFNIMGRIFASNQSGDFTCHTYPVYKPINTKDHSGLGKRLSVVVQDDPYVDRLPWMKVGGDAVWCFIVIFCTGLFMAVVLAIAAFVGARKSQKKMDFGSDNDEIDEMESDNAPRDGVVKMNPDEK